MVREVGSEAVILNLETGRYFGLDDVGARSLQALLGSASIQAAHAALLAEYDVDADVLRQDLTDLIRVLAEHGLIELHAA
jgi:hypothetical protein